MNDVKNSLGPKSFGRIWIVDDDQEMRSLLADFFKNRGHQVQTFPCAQDALQVLASLPATAAPLSGTSGVENEVDVVISDIKMPKVDGFSFASQFTQKRPGVPVILITAFGSIESAIQSMRSGAYDYVVKPFKLAEIELSVDRALEYRKLRMDNLLLRNEVKGNFSLDNVIGKSAAMKQVFDLVARVANANANVLVTGETGTGKEVVARAIHELGPRKNHPFVAINCTSIPDTLLESELFGHSKGSFTGAIQRKKGLFEEAQGGTLFLDEIGDMDPSLQAKLLRVIQERKIRAVGDNVDREVDVRIIAATHKDLKLAIKERRFREDLYYRLSVIPIHVPALRHRREDIMELANHFLRKYCARNNQNIHGFTEDAISKLVSQPWPGNVRELENVIERMVVLCQGSWISAEDFPATEEKMIDDFFAHTVETLPSLEALERKYIQYVMDKTGGQKTKAAQILGINRRTLYRKELDDTNGDSVERELSTTV